jgi:RNA 2',3'-cyclic 3'-phosphodiesterase
LSQTIRDFVAVEVNAEVRRAAAKLIELFRAAAADVKWVATANLHLTVKFLGETPLTDTARICEALRWATSRIEPFEMELGGAGAFPSVSRPRTIWLGGQGDDRPIVELVREVEERLQKLGYRKEGRRFQTHLTLGRVRSGCPAIAPLADLVKQHADYAAGKTDVSELVLFSSQLTPDGPIYQPIGRAKLGGD